MNYETALPILGWRVGQGSRERWWWWRLYQGSRGCVWKTSSCRGRAVLQVGLTLKCDVVSAARCSQFPFFLFFFLQAEGKGADGDAKESSWGRNWAPQEGDRTPAEGDWPPQGQNQKAEAWWLKLVPDLSFPKSMITSFWLTLLQVRAGP